MGQNGHAGGGPPTDLQLVLKKAWSDEYALHFRGARYVFQDQDFAALRNLSVLAAAEEWDERRCRSFFGYGIRYLERDSYWSERGIVLSAILRRVNEIVQDRVRLEAIRALSYNHGAVYELEEEETGLPPGEMARREMGKIREIIDRVGGRRGG